MTVLVCLGPTPDTWWQAKNTIGWALLERAAQVAPNEAAREAIMVGSNVHMLDFGDLEPPLREQVWLAVEESARTVAAEASDESYRWPPRWIAHVDELAREMEARRLQPDRPGAWPGKR